MGVAGVAVAAGELAATVGVDGVGEGELAAGDGLVEDAAGGEGVELDEVAVVGVGRLRGETGDAGEGGLEDGEEGNRPRTPLISLFVRLAACGEISACQREGQALRGYARAGGFAWIAMEPGVPGSVCGATCPAGRASCAEGGPSGRVYLSGRPIA